MTPQLRAVLGLIFAEGRSYGDAAAELNRRGEPTVSGRGRWWRPGVSRLLLAAGIKSKRGRPKKSNDRAR